MTKDKWMAEAKRYAKHAFCYEGMVDEFPEWFDASQAGDINPYDSVDAFAEKYDLDRADQDWGINSGVEFVKDSAITK